MTKYIKRFELTSQYEEYINSIIGLLPNVSIIKNINGVHYNSFLNYLKFTAEKNNSTISLNSKTSPDIKYSLNRSEWTQWDYKDITLNIGDTVYMKGNNSNGFSTGFSSYNTFNMSGKISASGNIMSLLYEDDFEGKLTIPCNYCFYQMFISCTALTATPELPATTLTYKCYESMFDGCTSLTTTPELPATILTDSCYSYMFRGCKSLTTTPELPATSLAYGCYFQMFYNCKSLITTPKLPATTLAENCYGYMFKGCKSLTITPELPATTLTPYCYNGMFDSCTSLTVASTLPATRVEDYCYQEMFSGCTNLNYIKMLATNIRADYCLDGWVYGVSSTGTFVKHPNMTLLPTGNSGIPNGWMVQDVA